MGKHHLKQLGKMIEYVLLHRPDEFAKYDFGIPPGLLTKNTEDTKKHKQKNQPKCDLF